MSLPANFNKPTAAVQIKGLPEAIALLNQFSNTDMPRTIDEALGTLGNDMVDQMQHDAPVDTGFLRDNIISQVLGTELRVDSLAGYSGFVNFGTIHQDPQPYFSNVVDRVAPVFTEMVRRDAIANIQRLVARYKVAR